MKPTDDEILEALGTDRLSGYQVASRIEDRWKVQGRREHFLFWTFSPMIGFGTIYRRLDDLLKQGLINRERHDLPDSTPPRFHYWRADQ